MKKLTSLVLTAALILSSVILLASCAMSGKDGGENSAIVGEWLARISFKYLLADAEGDAASSFESLGVDLAEYGITLKFEFKSSGNMTVGVDKDETEESSRALFEEYFDRLVKKSGKSEADVLSSMEYSDKEEAIDDMVKSTDFSSFSKEAVKYTFEDGVLGYGSAKIKAALDGDTLTLEEVLSESEKDEPYAFIEYHLPMELTKKQ